RAAARRRGHLQPPARADAPRHRRDAPLRPEHPTHAGDHRVAAPLELAVQHAQPAGPPADPDRQPRPRLDAGRRAPGEGRLPLLRAQGRLQEPLLHGQRAGVPRLPAHRPEQEVLSGRTRLVGIIGNPVAGSLSPRMQNAAFTARGLDWAYVALPVADENRLADAVRGLVALGFAGANVTVPYKRAVAALCKTDVPSVNTLVVEDERVLGYSTDAAILDGLPAERPVIIGAGGSAEAFRQALSHARVFSRRGEWPPDASGADLVVHATSERD